jgi:hypothetical protein
MSEARDLVSVIIPFWNEATVTLRAVRSALDQTHRNVEIILVDDGSTADISSIVALAGSEPRVSLLRQPNAGPAAARNRGIGAAQGEYVAFLDADDQFLPLKIERQFGLMRQYGVVFSHTSYYVSYPDRKPGWGLMRSGKFGGDCYPAIIGMCPLAMPTVMLHRSVLGNGFAFPSDLRVGEDLLAWIDLARSHTLLGIDEPLSIVEWSDNSAALDPVKQVLGLSFSIRALEGHPAHRKHTAEIDKQRQALLTVARAWIAADRKMEAATQLRLGQISVAYPRHPAFPEDGNGRAPPVSPLTLDSPRVKAQRNMLENKVLFEGQVFSDTVRLADILLTHTEDSSLRGRTVTSALTRWGFIHIPKAGGTSVQATLARVAAPGAVRTATPYDLANFPETIEDAVILTGHIPAFMFDWQERPRRLATVLRDPVQRVLSNYRYILATPGHYAHAFFERFRPSLADCFNHPVLRIEISDFQTKMLGWVARSNIFWPAHGHAKYATFSSEFADFFYCSADAETLATAKRRLMTDIQFACLDRPTSTLALCKSMASDAVSALGVENRTPPLSWAPTGEDLEAVAANNLLDKALYDFALDMIDRRSVAESAT